MRRQKQREFSFIIAFMHRYPFDYGAIGIFHGVHAERKTFFRTDRIFTENVFGKPLLKFTAALFPI